MRGLQTMTCLFAGCLLATPAAAHRRCPPPHRSSGGLPFETYVSFKAGGYDADPGWPGDGGGLFLGTEWGVSPIPLIDLGFSLDWFRRDASTELVAPADGPFPFPTEWEVASGVSSDLIPMGPVLRVRLPVGSSRLVPFLAGHLTYDVLRADWTSVTGDGSLVAEHEWFHGMGAGVSAGVEAQLAPGFGVLVEAGVHDSEPGRDLFVNGVPVQVRVDSGGEYARAGVRMAF